MAELMAYAWQVWILSLPPQKGFHPKIIAKQNGACVSYTGGPESIPGITWLSIAGCG